MKYTKIALATLCGGMMLASCTTIQRTAVVVDDMDSRIYQHPLVAELEVKPYAELTMNKAQLKGVSDPKAYITAELLKQSNADVLLEENVTTKRVGLLKRLQRMTVSGRPAAYTKYHSATEKDMDEFLNPETDEHSMLVPILADGQFEFNPPCYGFGEGGGHRSFLGIGGGNKAPKARKQRAPFQRQTNIEASLLVTKGVGFDFGIVKRFSRFFAWDALKLSYRFYAEDGPYWMERYNDNSYWGGGWNEEECFFNSHTVGLKTGLRFTTPQSSKGRMMFISCDVGLGISSLKNAEQSYTTVLQPGHWQTDDYGNKTWTSGGYGPKYSYENMGYVHFAPDFTIGFYLNKHFYVGYQCSMKVGDDELTSGPVVDHFGMIGISF